MSSPPSKLILLVEDDRDLRESMKELLALEGHQVFLAENGREALDMLGKTKPDVILLDLMMPIMDGYEFLQERRRLPEANSVPVLLLTAAGKEIIANDDVAGVVYKPVDVMRLLSVIDEITA